jgi:dihydroorotate dehydrogenase electron transfer subunit
MLIRANDAIPDARGNSNRIALSHHTPAESMPDPLSCTDAPLACQQIIRVVEQVRLARDTYRLRLAAPDLAEAVVPGQSFMIRAPGVTNPLLGRPFALYDTWLDGAGRPAGIDIVYLVVGKMTTLMSGWTAGDRVEVWGPLGNGFPLPTPKRLLLVAGGIGNTPFPAVAREALGQRVYGRRPGIDDGSSTGRSETERQGDGETGRSISPTPPLPHSPSLRLPLTPSQITFCYGTRSADYLAGLDDFAALGIDVRLATDDGTRGHHGFVTDLVDTWLEDAREDLEESTRKTERQRDGETGRNISPTPPLPISPSPPQASSLKPQASIFCCGPEPMMHAVAKLAAKHAVPCWLSLETPMACGFGACFSCVTRVKQPDGHWDYRRTCVEGPIFPAEMLAL